MGGGFAGMAGMVERAGKAEQAFSVTNIIKRTQDFLGIILISNFLDHGWAR